MDIQTRKIKFLQEFLKVQSEEVIAQLEDILEISYEYSDSEDFTPMSVEEFNERIDTSMKDSENGNLTESSDLKSIIDSWK
ncbi:hypothetical protein C8N46_10213 [Kordia periserrulae]|uniref:Uncharacterized protein n=1 Tax=Kordia periserrulae TaxID=701523 RepID=A0A2T6C2V2_9FLAO|nr:hypothetical protein [Kordia periserrulae]PTX62618.1 hypothetical protein C8N46_10213 [Kordia periserrulae]